MEKSEGRLQQDLKILPATKEGQSEDQDSIDKILLRCLRQLDLLHRDDIRQRMREGKAENSGRGGNRGHWGGKACLGEERDREQGW